jgi:phage host-nuclease inhibitor protein Gam
MRIIEFFKENINDTQKGIKENTDKQVDTLKEEINPLKKYKKTQSNTERNLTNWFKT